MMKACCTRLLLTALLICATDVSAQSVYAVDRQQVNVREDATTQSARIRVLRQHEEVVELRRVGQWMHVRMPDGTPGWIHAQLLVPRLLVVGEGVRMRARPSTAGASVTMLFRGQQVTRLSQSGNWTQVELLDGRTGWLSSQYVRDKMEQDLRIERPQPAHQTTAVEVATPAVAVQQRERENAAIGLKCFQKWLLNSFVYRRVQYGLALRDDVRDVAEYLFPVRGSVWWFWSNGWHGIAARCLLGDLSHDVVSFCPLLISSK